MNEHKQKRTTVAWAWAAGWLLVSMGMAISDVYSSPNRGLAAYTLLGFAGWAIGALAALVLGFSWGSTWNLGFLGPPVAMATGGAIGGGLTLPMRSLSSPAAMVRASIRGAIVWGVAFLVFQVLAFYAGYILVILTVNLLFPIVGTVWAKVPGWGKPLEREIRERNAKTTKALAAGDSYRLERDQMRRKSIAFLASVLVITIVGACASQPMPTPTPTPPPTPELVSVIVYFTDNNRYAVGTPPFEAAVTRTVPASANLAQAVLLAFFDGPTPEEGEQGLEAITSGFDGFSGLVIEDGIARLYLRGECASLGATYTVAQPIMKNLLQFPEVLYVKIYDENGETEVPEGESNSIPFCLEP